jgi:hypothetical protein
LFEYLFMSFGLMNAAQTFPRLMNHLYCHLPFVFTYLDDHLIASRTTEEHLEHFKSFFSVLHKNRLTINTAKFTFAVGSVKFLEYMVSKSSLDLLQKHIAAIQNFLLPQDIRQLQRFLGLVNFYRLFFPAIEQKLTDLLQGNPKSLSWSTAAAVIFEGAKSGLVTAVPLNHSARPEFHHGLVVDASQSHVGGVLQQLQGHT